MKKLLYALEFLCVTLSIALIAALLKVASPLTVIRILDLNMSGSEKLKGQNARIAKFICWKKFINSSNVITLQEVCHSQYEAIRTALGSGWFGSFKSFGPMPGCNPHGLAIFTWGQHTDLQWFEVDSDREYTHVKDGVYKKIDYIWVTRQPIYVWGDAHDSASNHRLLRGVIILKPKAQKTRRT